MTGRDKIYVGLLLLLLLGLGVLDRMTPATTDWSPSFSRYHRKPYGSKYVYERLPDLFGKQVGTVDRSELEEQRALWYQDVEGPRNHIYVKDHFLLPRHDLNALLEQVADGDQLFVATWYFGTLGDTLGLRVDRDGFAEEMTLRFLQQPLERRTYTLPVMHNPGYFDRLPAAANILAVNGSSNPVFAHVAWGDGDIWLCAEPRVLTNHHLLHRRNATAIAIMLSHLPEAPVLWNEFRKTNPDGRMTPLRWILDQPALSWAYFLSLALVLLFMVTRARREQRAIPIIPPVRNDSRDFVHTVGRLYHNKADHGDLARKMIAYFKDDVRQRAHIHRFAYDPETADRLAKRTGTTAKNMLADLERIRAFELQERTSALQLLELEALLQRIRTRL